MTGLPLILAFIVAIVLMIVMISKFKIHPFISIMLISVVLGIIAGIPIVDQTLEDGTKVSGLASVIGAGFSGTFSSIGIVIILGALIGHQACRQEPPGPRHGAHGLGRLYPGLL